MCVCVRACVCVCTRCVQVWPGFYSPLVGRLVAHVILYDVVCEARKGTLASEHRESLCDPQAFFHLCIAVAAHVGKPVSGCDFLCGINKCCARSLGTLAGV